MCTRRYDTGPIVAQAVVPVSPTDTPKQLAARVLLKVNGKTVLARQVCNLARYFVNMQLQTVAQEHRLYPHVVQALVDGRINWRADGIPVIWSAH